MSLYSSAIPNMVNGVSQQPDTLRMPSQCAEQINCYPSVVEGLVKRAPTHHLARLSATPLDGAYVHTINRDSNERYIVAITNGNLRVFELNGVERQVRFPGGSNYLNNANPRTGFKAVTVADHTFILNRGVRVAMAPNLTRDRGVEALVFVKQANYAVTMSLEVAGIAKNYIYPDTAPIATTTAVEWFATQFATDLAQYYPNQYRVQYRGSTVHITRNDGQPFLVNAWDSAGNSHITAIVNKVQHFNQLPTHAWGGMVVEVLGDEQSDRDNYFVEFEPNTGNATDWGAGAWVEAVAPGIPVGFDATTMPHILVRQADGTFEFRPADWGLRTVGSEKSAREPSFVGRTINDVFFHKNRLGFLADENVVMSEAGSYFNFWPTTVTTLVDSDPLDVAASHTKVSILRHAVPYNQKLLLFSDQTQFALDKETLLTSDPPPVNVLTEFESNLDAKPIGVGKTVYFATPKGRNSGIREFYIEEASDTQDAADVTAHVPTYIPSGVFKLAASTNEDVLFVLSSNAPNVAHVYKFFWSGNEKVQSAWGKFVFDPSCTILNVDFIESSAFFVIQHSDGVYLERMDMEAGITDEGVPYVYLLDRRVSHRDLPLAYDPETDTTRVTLPYLPDDPEQMEAVMGSDTPGRVVRIEAVEGNTLVLQGNHSDRSKTLWIGARYRALYRFSRPVVREQSPGGGRAAVGEGRLQVRFWSVTYSDTGFFRARVKVETRDDRLYTFTGWIVGAASSKLGAVTPSSGIFKFPVQSRNDRMTVELENDTFLPSRFVSAEWEGTYTIRSRRL